MAEVAGEVDVDRGEEAGHAGEQASEVTTSEPLEREVAVQAQHRLAPHEHEGWLPQLEDPVVDEPHRVPEGTDSVRQGSLHLRLAGRESLGVLLLLLVVAEKALHRCSLVGVLAGEDHLDAELEQVLSHLFAAVVGGVVEEPVGVLSPVGRLFGEEQGES